MPSMTSILGIPEILGQHGAIYGIRLKSSPMGEDFIPAGIEIWLDDGRVVTLEAYEPGVELRLLVRPAEKLPNYPEGYPFSEPPEFSRIDSDRVNKSPFEEPELEAIGAGIDSPWVDIAGLAIMVAFVLGVITIFVWGT